MASGLVREELPVQWQNKQGVEESADLDPSNLSKVLVTWQVRPGYLLWGSDRMSLRVLFSQGDSAPCARRRGARAWSAPDTEGSAILPRFPLPCQAPRPLVHSFRSTSSFPIHSYL